MSLKEHAQQRSSLKASSGGYTNYSTGGDSGGSDHSPPAGDGVQPLTVSSVAAASAASGGTKTKERDDEVASGMSSFDGYEDGNAGSGKNDSLRTTRRKVRKAYKKLDGTKSKTAHQNLIDIGADLMENTENHKKHGEYVKSIIYGGLDGVFTTFALVAGFQGAGSTFEDAATMLVFGFANVVADALSMGFGDFLSEKAEIDFAVSERAREEWEFDNYRKGEIDEMIQIYMSKGMSYDDASSILNTMAKYKDFFIDHMMIQELEIYPVNINSDDYDEYAAMKNGVVTFMSFLVFGSVPLLSYVVFEIAGGGSSVEDDIPNFKFYMCIVLSILTLMTLGLVKGKLTESNLVWATTFVTLNGIVAAAASYFLGWGLGKLVGIDS